MPAGILGWSVGCVYILFPHLVNLSLGLSGTFILTETA